MERGGRPEKALRVRDVVVGAEVALLRTPAQGVVAAGRVRAMRRDRDGVGLASPRREDGQAVSPGSPEPQLVHRIAREGRHVQVAAVDAEAVVAVDRRRSPMPGARRHWLQPFAGLLCCAQVAAGMLAALAIKLRREFEVAVGR